MAAKSSQLLSLGRYMDGAVKSLNAQKAIEFHRLKEAWLKSVGPVLAGQAEPTRLRGNVLYITVSSPAWSQEIQMQQRLILGRLKDLMRKPPTRLACFVGQPHQVRDAGGGAPRQEQDVKVPWAGFPIPPDRQANIEQTLANAGLSDPEQAAKLRFLIELSVRRELYFLAQGQLPCPICGHMRPTEQDNCDSCERERLEQAERKLVRLMARQPWLKLRDLHDRAPWAGRAQLLRLRKALHTNLLQQAWQLSEGMEGAELTAKMTPAYRKLLLDVAMLRCYLPSSSLKPHHLKLALGKRLAAAYLASLEEAPREE